MSVNRGEEPRYVVEVDEPVIPSGGDEGTIEMSSDEDGGLALSDSNGIIAVVPPSNGPVDAEAPDVESIEDDSFEESFENEKPRRKKRGACVMIYVLLALALVIATITYSVRRNNDRSSSRDFAAAVSDGNPDAGSDVVATTTTAATTAAVTTAAATTAADIATTAAATTEAVDPTTLPDVEATPSPTTVPDTVASANPTPAPTTLCVSALVMDQLCVNSPTSITADLVNCNPADDDWVGIYPAPSLPSNLMGDDYVEWIWACGSKDCDVAVSTNQVVIDLPALENGRYQAHLMKNTESNDGPFDVITAGPIFEVTDGTCEVV